LKGSAEDRVIASFNGRKLRKYGGNFEVGRESKSVKELLVEEPTRYCCGWRYSGVAETIVGMARPRKSKEGSLTCS